MDDDSLVQFVERLKVDDELRQKVVYAEEVALSNMTRDTDAVARIAAEAGFDISGWTNRPARIRPAPTFEELESDVCTITCCLVTTSTMAGP